MSESMVERVAKALLASDQADGHADADCVHLSYMKTARAAIETMREPTEEMVTQGLQKPMGMMNWRDAVGVSWQAMIDAALAEPPSA